MNGEKLICFANDIAIIANDDKDLEKLSKTVSKTFKEVLNMKINVQKTKILICGRVKCSTRVRLRIGDDHEIKQRNGLAVTEEKKRR